MKLNIRPVLLSLVMITLTASAQAEIHQEEATAKSWLKYYSEHLLEAKQTLHECVTKGFDKIIGDDKIKCEAARDAWQFQPYKPTKK